MFDAAIATESLAACGVAAEDVYRRLTGGAEPDEVPFDLHIIACILALAAQEAATRGQPLSATTGLAADEIDALMRELFPQATPLPDGFPDEPPVRSDDEACLLDLLQRCTAGATPFQRLLAVMVARRAQSPDHLWQDLGLRSRAELSRLMRTHFPALAARNTQDMKWKKFLYRMICRDADYALCTAPSCAECTDFEVCFGDESGESRLARVRRAEDRGGEAPLRA